MAKEGLPIYPWPSAPEPVRRMHLYPVPFRFPAPIREGSPLRDLQEFFDRELQFTAAILTYLVLGRAYVDWPNTGLEGVGRYLLEPHGL